MKAQPFDVRVLRAAVDLGVGDFMCYDVARSLYARPTVRTFNNVRLSLLQLARNKDAFRGRRVIWTNDDGNDVFYTVPVARRVRMSMAALDARILEVRHS
jgi:hypothetical protein